MGINTIFYLMIGVQMLINKVRVMMKIGMKLIYYTMMEIKDYLK